MTLPPFVYSLAFWKGISVLAEGVLVLLVYFGILPDTYLYGSAAILAVILSVLYFIGVVPELRAKGQIK